MAQITKEIVVDVAKKNLFQAIVAKQNDNNSRFLKVTLCNEGVKIEIPSSATAIINAERADNSSKAFAGTVNSDGTVTVPLTNWMLGLDDVVRCSISVIGSDEQKLTSTSFSIDVEAAEYEGSDITEDENYDILITLISDVSDAKLACETASTAANSATELAQAATTSANNAATSAATAANSATTAATAANEAAESAENSAAAADTAAANANVAATAANSAAAKATEVTTQVQEQITNAVNGNAVKFSGKQELSDEQKSTARENIGAVAADNVVFTKSDKPEVEESELIYSIAGIQNLLYRNAVLSTIDQSASEAANWTDAKKAMARKNMDVDGGKWVLLRTYTTDGVNKAFGDDTTSNVATTTTDGDGNAFSLSAVSVVFKNTAAASANSYAALFAYCNADNESLSAGYAISTNAINTKANAQGVAMVLPERGYYRSLSVNGGTNASVNLCENPSQMFSTASSNTIKRIKITLGAIPPADDIIEIWGIKA